MTTQLDIVFLIIAILFCVFSVFVFIRVRRIKVNKEEQVQQKKRLQSQIQQLRLDKKEIADLVQEEKNNLTEIKTQVQLQKKLASQKREQVSALNASVLQRSQEISNNLDSFYQEEKNKTDQKLAQYKKVTDGAANMYIDTLEKKYESAEASHKAKMTQLNEEYETAAADLQSLKDTRKAAYEAVLKQKEVKQNLNNYRLIPSTIDLEDIYALSHIKQGLHKPRILSMLIWQTYWLPLAKEKFPIILQDKTKTGIYKITNIQTDQCYIGQSLDIYKRWTDHCKAGLGIDTPAGNKLYKSMQDYGLENFTFELLCECPKNELNDKESYFIELYQSDLYGFNAQKGIK